MNWTDVLGVLMNPWTITIGGGLFILLTGYLFKGKIPKDFHGHSLTQSNAQNVTVNNNFGASVTSQPIQGSSATISVLFIDDDTRFKIINILKKNSWIKCQIMKDINDFDNTDLVQAHVIFVDIEGVGRTLTPQEQGLGIVTEIKRRYPEKKVIIYSSQPVRDMTNPAFRIADGVLRKDAQPSEFLKYIEDARNQ